MATFPSTPSTSGAAAAAAAADDDDDAAALVLEAALQAQAEAEIGEPATLEGKRAQLAELRRRIAALPRTQDRLQDTSARNLVRFLRLSKHKMDKAVGRTVEYARFFASNHAHLGGMQPEAELPVFRNLVQVLEDVPGTEGRVVVCLFPKLAVSNITAAMLAQNPRILLRMNVWVFERLSLDVRVQVRGLILLNSFRDADTAAAVPLSQLANLSERRLAFQFFSLMGFRLKVAMVFEEPAFLSWAWFIIKQFTSAKVRERFLLCGTDYARLDAVLGEAARRHLPEPFKSLGASAAVVGGERPSWILEQIAADAAEKAARATRE